MINKNTRQTELDFSIVSPELTIEAMRDSGYKDTDHALAELIDNALEAGASLVEVVVVETPPDASQRYARAQVSQIAVVDNGEGMDPTTLRRALRFGDGTRKDRRKQGIGRFGVGLPQSSISQCQRVDVWTWRNGADNAIRCYLDLEEIKKNGRHDVPQALPLPVPEKWRELASNTAEAKGTLVMWSKLDRVRWSGGTKTLQRTGELCGRVYRKFLADEVDPKQIDLILASDESGILTTVSTEVCAPNDPLYLMTPSSTPEPFRDRPMFKHYHERSWKVKGVDGIDGKINVRCAMARPDAISQSKSSVPWPRSYANPGDAPWGKHASRNTGVSIIRARRELEVSLAWVNNYEPTERWWSVEVEFDPILDEIFGVVNNKQHAHTFVGGAGFDWKDASYPEEGLSDFRDRLEESGDPRFHLMDVWTWIDQQITAMRQERKEIVRNVRTGPRHPVTDETPEKVVSDLINEEKERGEMGGTDSAPEISREEKVQQLAESAKRNKVTEETALEWAIETVDNDRRVLMKAVRLGHRDAFFAVESVNDVIEVWLNDRHPVHEHLIDVLAEDDEEQTPQDLAKRLGKAAFALRMLLFAWARNEDKAPAEMRETLEDVRMDWGREARNFLKVIES